MLRKRKHISVSAKTSIFILILFLAIFEVISRNKWLFSQLYLPNYDFFYYLQELTYRVQTGKGYYLIFSPFFDILVFISRVLFLSPLNTIKMVILWNLATFSTGIILLGYNKKYWYLIPILIYFVWGSDIIFYSSYEFIRQASSISFIPLGIYFINKHSKTRGQTRISLPLIIGIVLMLFSSIIHIFGLAIVTLYLLIISTKWNNKKIRLLFLLFLSVLLFLNLHKFYLLFSSLSLSFPLYNIFIEDKINGIGFFMNLLIGAFIMVFRLRTKEKSSISWLLWTLFILFYLPIWKTESGSYVVRFTYSSAFLLIIAFTYDLSQSFSERYKKKLILAIFMLFLSNVIANVIHRPALDEASPNPSLEAIISNKEILNRWLPENALVVTPQGVQYRITYFLHRQAVNYKGYIINNEQYPAYTISNLRPTSLECFGTDGVLSDLQAINCIHLEKDWYIWNSKYEKRK